MDLTQHSYELGQTVLNGLPLAVRKEKGQFLTVPAIAHYMATQLGSIPDTGSILEPAVGSGVLACAIIERAIQDGHPLRFSITGYDIDAELCGAARAALAEAARQASAHGIEVKTEIHQEDFILTHAMKLQSTPLAKKYDFVISNPPYFKLNQRDERVRVLGSQVRGTTNIYTLFMGLGTKLLKTGGRACFIVPRSFCSGTYFSRFRRDFIRQVDIERVHLFESRENAFKGDAVLQENIILTLRKPKIGSDKYGVNVPKIGTSSTVPVGEAKLSEVCVSSTMGVEELDNEATHIQVSMEHFIKRRNGSVFFRLPTSELDKVIVETIEAWRSSLEAYGLKVSTGPVVPFRARNLLVAEEAVRRSVAVPLLWMQNVQAGCIKWPVKHGRKPQAILTAPEARSILVPVVNYVLVRRFSAKEERRRLTSAPLLRDNFDYQRVGLENHLNYIYRKEGELSKAEAIGLSAILNSALVDRYFRILNGSTQVNATELRALPLPPMDVIVEIGHRALDSNPALMDDIVLTLLRERKLIGKGYPAVKET